MTKIANQLFNGDKIKYTHNLKQTFGTTETDLILQNCNVTLNTPILFRMI